MVDIPLSRSFTFWASTSLSKQNWRSLTAGSSSLGSAFVSWVLEAALLAKTPMMPLGLGQVLAPLFDSRLWTSGGGVCCVSLACWGSAVLKGTAAGQRIALYLKKHNKCSHRRTAVAFLMLVLNTQLPIKQNVYIQLRKRVWQKKQSWVTRGAGNCRSDAEVRAEHLCSALNFSLVNGILF